MHTWARKVKIRVAEGIPDLSEGSDANANDMRRESLKFDLVFGRVQLKVASLLQAIEEDMCNLAYSTRWESSEKSRASMAR